MNKGKGVYTKITQNRGRQPVHPDNKRRALLRNNNTLQKKLIILCLFLGINAALSSISQAATYYIDPARGSDSSNGSANAPWQSINKAKSTVSAGDVVNLLPGNYGSVTFFNKFFDFSI